MLDAATERFIDQVGRLPASSLAEAFDAALALRRAGGRDASRATKPSAAENSEIDHSVRSTLLPRAEELDAHRPGLHSDAKSAAVIGARAIQKRGTLTAAQYEVLLRPFQAIGVEVPAHSGDD
jgi:hypothetical protein